MKLKTRIMSGVLATLMLFAVACEEDDIDPVDSGTNPGTSSDDDSGGVFDVSSKTNVGEVIWLGYYDLNSEGSEGAASMTEIFKERHGGTIQYVFVGCVEYYDKLAVMISNDQSPDLIRSEWASFPDGMNKNQYEPLQDYIDLDSPLWSGMKEYIEKFMWKDNLYFPALRVAPDLTFVINYDYNLLQQNGFEDPYELYTRGEWTLSKMYEMMAKWVQMDKDNHIGYSGLNSLPFVATTGKQFLEIKPDGTYNNNLKDPDVDSIMRYLEDNFNNSSLKLTNNEWVGPENGKPFQDKIRMFYGMGLDWSVTTIGQGIKDGKFRFVPYPKYDNADKHYTNANLFGYLIPKGAKNLEGSLTWIYLNRQEEINPETLATARENAINPPKAYYKSGSKQGQERWVYAWEPEMWDLRTDLGNPEKFGHVFEQAYGLGKKIEDLYAYTIMQEPLMGNGETTWTMVKEEQYDVIEAEIKNVLG